MARTGISIKVSNTVLGNPPQVNANSMLVVAGATAVPDATLAFVLNTPYMLQSASDLEQLGITEANNKDVYRQVNDFYAPKQGLNTSGTILWLVGTENNEVSTLLPDWVRATVIDGFQYRPRNILISFVNEGEAGATMPDISEIQTAVDALYVDGFSTVVLAGQTRLEGGPITDTYNQANLVPDLSTKQAGMVGVVIVTNRQGDRACVGALGGYLSTLSVGTSIGDSSTLPFASDMYYVDATVAAEVVTWVNTPCATVRQGVVNTLGDKQYLFTRTRPPRNGLWWNDGATGESADTALSTIEAARTIASLVDDLRSFFTPYINQRVPVTVDGDIQGTYKQVVLDNARASVVLPYIESSDISDARISLQAKDHDMVGTRTWEVTLEVLPAPTLRWIDGYVFYVKSL